MSRLISHKKLGEQQRSTNAFLDAERCCIVFAPGGSQPQPNLEHPFVQRLLSFGCRCVIGVDLQMRNQWSPKESVDDLSRCLDGWREKEFGSIVTEIQMILIGYSTGSWLMNKFWITRKPRWFSGDSCLIDVAGTLQPQPGIHSDFVANYWTVDACLQDKKRMALMQKFHGESWRNVVKTVHAWFTGAFETTVNSIYPAGEAEIQILTKDNNVFFISGSLDVVSDEILMHLDVRTAAQQFFMMNDMQHFDYLNTDSMGECPIGIDRTCAALRAILMNRMPFESKINVTQPPAIAARL